MRPITPGSLLDSICWSISEPTSTASIYTESSSVENAVEDQTSMFFDAKEDGKESEASFVNLSRPLTERLAKTLWSCYSNLVYNAYTTKKRFLSAYILDILDFHLSVHYAWHKLQREVWVNIERPFPHDHVPCRPVFWDGPMLKDILQQQRLYMFAGVGLYLCILPGMHFSPNLRVLEQIS